MNVQPHMSEQISGQAPNQAGNQLPVLPQQNGNLPSQMQNLGGPLTFNTDTDFVRARLFMQNKIYDILQQRQVQPINDNQKRRLRDFAKYLENGLLKTALTKEDYMNLDTLESRLPNLISRLPNQTQRYPQHVNSSSPIGPMIPTPRMPPNMSCSPVGPMIPPPRMPPSGNSNMMFTPSADTSMIATSTIASNTVSAENLSVNAENLLPTGGIHGYGSFNRSNGHV